MRLYRHFTFFGIEYSLSYFLCPALYIQLKILNNQFYTHKTAPIENREQPMLTITHSAEGEGRNNISTHHGNRGIYSLTGNKIVQIVNECQCRIIMNIDNHIKGLKQGDRSFIRTDRSLNNQKFLLDRRIDIPIEYMNLIKGRLQ